MGKTISLLRPPQPPREGERERGMMELRKRPRPPHVDQDFVSSPPPLQPRKRSRKQAAATKPREAAGAAKRQPPPKTERCAGLGIGSPITGLHPARCVQSAVPLPPGTSRRVSIHRPRHPFNWYEPDMWTEVAKHLRGSDLLRLSGTCRWFRRLLADDSIWRYAFFRDLDLDLPAVIPHTPRPLHRSWRLLHFVTFNGSHAYWFREGDKHISGYRIGGFLLESPKVLLTGQLPLPRWLPLNADDVQPVIGMMGACVISNARPGVWIADMHVVRCPLCNLKNCQGTMQVLDARHSEMFLEKAYVDGTLEYEDLGEHFHDEEAAAAFCAVFNVKQLASPSTACLLNTNSWIGKRNDLEAKWLCTTYAAAVNSNLKRNRGLLSRFEAMRDTTREGQVVSVRISQVLF